MSSSTGEGEKDKSYPVETIFQAVEAITAAGMREAFLDICKTERFTVTVDPDLVDAARTHYAKAAGKQESTALLESRNIRAPSCF